MARRRTNLAKADTQETTSTGTVYDLPPLTPGLGEPVPTPPGSAESADTDLSTYQPEEILAEPPDARDISAELSAPPRRKLPWLPLLLSGGVVAALAFAGGALVEKNQLQGSSGATGASFAAGRGGIGGGAGAGAGFGRAGAGRSFGSGTGGAGTAAGSGLTFGTIKLVDGSTIYLTDAQGDIIKVTTGGSTQITEAKSGKVSDLQPGQTVTVRGTTNSSGDIAATTVAEGALGGGAGRLGTAGSTGSGNGG